MKNMKKIYIILSLSILLIVVIGTLAKLILPIHKELSAGTKFCYEFCVDPSKYLDEYEFVRSFEPWDFACQCDYHNGTVVDYYFYRPITVTYGGICQGCEFV